MKKFTTLALPLVMALVLSACGGGGSGGGSASSGATAVGSNAPSSPSGPAPNAQAQPDLSADLPPPSTDLLQAGAFSALGPVVLASNLGHSSDRGLASAARLTGGGSVVAWAANTSLQVQRLDAAGKPAGAAQSVGTVLLGDADVSTRLSVVATADGGWLVAWIAADRTVLFRRYDASGAPVAGAMPVDATAFSKVLGIQARALADGGFVVAWVAAEGTDPARALLRRFSAEGTPITDRVGVSSGAGSQLAVQVTPMPDGAFLAAWVQRSADGSESVLARRLDAGLHAAGPENALQAAAPQPDAWVHRYSLLGAASVSQRAALFAWAYYDGRGLQVRWQLFDASGTPTIPATRSAQVDLPLNRFLDSVEVIPAAGGFRVVAESSWANYRVTEAFTTLLAIGGAGELLASTETARVLSSIEVTTGAGCFGPGRPGVAASGGEDGHYLLAYATCAAKGPAPEPVPPANLEVMGR